MRSLHAWPIFPQNFGSSTNRSISLLFTLQEYLASQNLLHTMQKQFPIEKNDIKKQIDLWIFSSLNNPLTQNEGALDKLCFYTRIMLTAFKNEDKKIPLLLEKMRGAVIGVRDHRIAIEKLPEELREAFYEFFLALRPFLQDSRTDENVLLYLIEHRETFNLHLGKETIETILHNFFPAGKHELRATLCEGFTRRGFASFFASQEHLLEGLE